MDAICRVNYRTCIDIAVGYVLLMVLLLVPAPCSAGRRVYPPSEWWGIPLYSPDGKWLAVQSPPAAKIPSAFKNSAIFEANANPDRQTLILEAKNHSLVAFAGRAIYSAWSPDGKFLAALVQGNVGNYAAVYKASSGLLVRKIAVEDAYGHLSWAPDSNRLALTQRNEIVIYDLRNKIESQLPTTDKEFNWKLPVWSPDGASVAAFANQPYKMNRTDRIKIWNSISLSCTKSIDVASGMNSLFWSKNGRRILFSEPEKIAAFDTTLGAITGVVKGRECTSLAYSPKRTYLVFKDRDRVRILNPDSLSETFIFQGPKNAPFTFELSPNENYLLIDQGKTASVFEISTGKALGYYSWSDLGSARWAQDGKSIILAGTGDAPKFLTVNLSKQGARSCFEGGRSGAPKWDNHPCPANLEQCFAAFDKGLTSKQRDRFKNTKANDIMMFGGGSFLADPMMFNLSSKWDQFELEKFFKTKGITDPRDINDIVLDSYWRRLNAKPVEIDKLAKAHRNWWQSRAPAVEENRQLSPELLDYSAHDEIAGAFTIRSLKHRLKIVSFVSTCGASSALQMKVLEKLRRKYPNKDMAFVIFLVSPSDMLAMQWRLDEHPKVAADNSAAFRRMAADGFRISQASSDLCKKYVQFQSETVSKTLGPPQTLVIDKGGFVKFRLNGFTPETEKVLESEIEDEF